MDIEGVGKVAVSRPVPGRSIVGRDGGEAEHPHRPGPQDRRQGQKGQGGADTEGLPARSPKPGRQQRRPRQQDLDNAGSHLPLCRVVEERRVVVLCHLPGYSDVVPEVVAPPEKEQYGQKGQGSDFVLIPVGEALFQQVVQQGGEGQAQGQSDPKIHHDPSHR